jgi:hypothetical protein
MRRRIAIVDAVDERFEGYCFWRHIVITIPKRLCWQLSFIRYRLARKHRRTPPTADVRLSGAEECVWNHVAAARALKKVRVARHVELGDPSGNQPQLAVPRWARPGLLFAVCPTYCPRNNWPPITAIVVPERSRISGGAFLRLWSMACATAGCSLSVTGPHRR